MGPLNLRNGTCTRTQRFSSTRMCLWAKQNIQCKHFPDSTSTSSLAICKYARQSLWPVAPAMVSAFVYDPTSQSQWSYVFTIMGPLCVLISIYSHWRAQKRTTFTLRQTLCSAGLQRTNRSPSRRRCRKMSKQVRTSERSLPFDNSSVLVDCVCSLS